MNQLTITFWISTSYEAFYLCEIFGSKILETVQSSLPSFKLYLSRRNWNKYSLPTMFPISLDIIFSAPLSNKMNIIDPVSSSTLVCILQLFHLQICQQRCVYIYYVCACVNFKIYFQNCYYIFGTQHHLWLTLVLQIQARLYHAHHTIKLL